MKRNLVNIILWVLSGFMLIGAIVFLPSAASVAMLLFAVLAAPVPVIQKFLSKKGLRGWVKTALLVVIFSVAVFLTPSDKNSDTQGNSAAALNSLEPHIAASTAALVTPETTPIATSTLKPTPVQEKVHPSPAPSSTSDIFPTDDGINEFLKAYNAISEEKATVENTQKGNIKTKALISLDTAYVEIINSTNGFSISIDTQTDSDSDLYSVFRSFAFSLNNSLTEVETETAWHDIQIGKYEIDYNGTGNVDTYELGGIQLQYLPGLYGKPSVNMLYRVIPSETMVAVSSMPAPTPTPIPEPEQVRTPEPVEQMVWIPTNGGKKYHSKSSCSGMKGPKQVTISSAKAQGFEACKRCY